MTEKDTYLSLDNAVIMKKILQFQPTVFFFVESIWWEIHYVSTFPFAIHVASSI